jgi:hypothetical protein
MRSWNRAVTNLGSSAFPSKLYFYGIENENAFSVRTLFLVLSFTAINNVTIITSMETDRCNNKGNVMTNRMSKKYKHCDYADFEFISDTFKEHRIYTFMCNRYVELEIYTTGE